MGRPNIFFKGGRWHITGKGADIVAFDEGGMEVGNTGAKIAKIYAFVGSSAAIAAIGTCKTATGTIIGATGLAVGDKIFGNRREAMAAGVAVAGFLVATTNCLNFFVVNTEPNTAGSLTVSTWGIVAVR